MRRFVMLLLLFVTFPVFALSPNIIPGDGIVAIAWQEGNTWQVAVGNPNNTRSTVTISTPTLDVWGRPVFTSRRVTIPGRTIVQESFTPEVPRRGAEPRILIKEGYRSWEIDVQSSEILMVKEFVIPANTDWEAAIDLGFLWGVGDGIRLVIDDNYSTSEGRQRGPVTLTLVEGGLRRVGYSNSIEFVRPKAHVKLRTPPGAGLTVLTFGMRVEGGEYGRRGEEIPGPTILVYGRNIRFQGAPASGGSGRVKY